MRRLMTVIASGWSDLGPLVTHHLPLDRIEAVYDLLANQGDGVRKVAIAARSACPPTPLASGAGGSRVG